MCPSRRFLLLLLLLLWPVVARGQASPGPQASAWQHEEGFPFFFQHYTPQDYRQYYQNWAVTQDPRGVIYVANNDGILEYDGASWRLIETPSGEVVRSLDVDDDGILYAGQKGDFGYLKPDSSGTLTFDSLLDQLAPQDRDVKDVWGSHATSDGVFFQTNDRLFRWHGGVMKFWRSEPGFHTSFTVHDRFYVREKGVGLLHVVDDSLALAPGGQFFAEWRIFMMAPYRDGRVLIGTREAGLFLYDGVSVKAFPTEIDGMLRAYRLYHGCALPGGFYALATLDGGGVFILDEQGRLRQRLYRPPGQEDWPAVLDDWVNFVYADAQGGLWMALDTQGVIRVDVPSQLSLFDRRSKLEGIVSDIQRHRGRLYVATSKGLFVLDQPPTSAGAHNGFASFKKLLDKTSSWVVQSADSVLFVGTDNGLFAVRQDNPVRVIPDEVVFEVLASRRLPGQFFLGARSGLHRLAYTGGRWTLVERGVGGIKKDVHAMAEENDGTLWVATASGEVRRLAFQAGQDAPQVQVFGQQDGLPDTDIRIDLVEGKAVFTSAQGVYRFGPLDSTTGEARFHRDMALAPADASASDSLLTSFQQPTGAFWMVYADRVEMAVPQPQGAYALQVPAVLRFPKAKQVRLYVEADGIAWMGNGTQVVRYDPHVDGHYEAGFSVLVRSLTSIATRHVLYGGASLQAPVEVPSFDNFHNDLRFEVAAPSYNDVSVTQYQFYLEGKDAAWSDWTAEPGKTYTNLTPHAYTFRVRARNAQGIVSKEAAFTFLILPPWYRTWWAYGFYLLTVLAVSALSWRHYTVLQENKRAQEQARELAQERHINERLQQANRRLQEANESLRQANQLKDEFLANTSHELRTPLTAILGFTAVLKEEVPEEFLEFLDPIESNGQRLLNTVNSLLDIAKLRAGMMEILREEVDMGAQAAELIRLLAPLAQQKHLLLELVRPPQPLYVHLDRRFLERILYNLIGNAIKFTETGKVSVLVERDGDYVCLRVSDTGIGIDADFIPHLFDEFKQESTGLARLHEGSGLGLAITARLVKLMDGDIFVESEKGQGSTFSIVFPVYEPVVAEPTAVS